MATLEDQLLSSFQQTVSTKGPTIELESDVVQAKKTPLTYEQMKEILESWSNSSAVYGSYKRNCRFWNRSGWY